MEPEGSGIRVVTVLGTSRPGNYTGRALALVHDELRRAGVQVESFDPGEMQLEFPGHSPTEDASRLQEAIREATAVVLSTPEYHGSFSSILKLIVENLGFPSALSGKPVALLGVAAGRIGAIKSLEHLASVCAHVGAIVLPGVVSVAHVQRLFDERGNCLDEAIEKRLRGVATHLIGYVRQNICPRVALEAMVREQL